ncbi:MAG: sugar transferase [Lachnospiraceae bacterium]
MNQISQRNKITELYCLLAADLFVIILSYSIAVWLKLGTLSVMNKGEIHYMVCLCLMLFCTMFSLLIDWNKDFLKRGYFVELITVLKYNAIMLIGIGCFLFVTKQAYIFSRLVWGYFAIFNTLFTYLAHCIVKKILTRYMKSERCRVQIMLITEQANVEETLRNLSQSMLINYEITALTIVDSDAIGTAYHGIPVVANRTNVMEVARQIPLDEVFISLQHESNEAVQAIIRDFESMGVICHYSINMTTWKSKESSIGKFGDYIVVTYAIYQIDYQRRMIKRIMDIVGGVIGLSITVLLLPWIALAIKLNSTGPVFFSQTRIGKNGRRFKLYKFRSMYTDAEERKKELQEKNQMGGLMFKMDNDPRITAVGRFLRKTSLDELPQFYNVLRGDMSLIGTRPPTEDEFEHYSLYYRRRLCMTPGLTGLWQVSGRSNIADFDDVVKYDLEYINNWSLSLDIKILIRTIWVVMIGRGSK